MLWRLVCWVTPVLPGAREITFANDFDGLPLGLAAHTDPMRGTSPI